MVENPLFCWMVIKKVEQLYTNKSNQERKKYVGQKSKTLLRVF